MNDITIVRKARELERPRVLQVLPALDRGGAERSAVDVSVAVAAAGGGAVVASEGGPLERELLRGGVPHVKLPLASKNPFVMRSNVQRLERLIAEKEINIVHARSRAPAWSAYYAARNRKVHFVTTFHGTYNFRTGLKKRYNAIMAKGERVIANSDFIAQHLREHYEIEPGRVRVIHRGVDLQRFDPDNVSAERVIQLARRWRLPDGLPIVLLPGRLTRWTGQSLLLQALTRLGTRDYRAILVGSDQGREAYRRELEETIDKLGLAEKAFLLDNCDDMPAAYKLADVVVSASTDPEAFGRVVSEAQAMGRPVVAADHGGVPEQVIPEVTAFLFEPRSAEALAAALEKALDLGEGARNSLAEVAITHVRVKFDKERMCAATLGIYQELLRQDAYAL
ncbi:MAG: glycosyltransferase family 4 protein [Kiloniellales bacterium]